jgi:cytochrome c biogenesis protein CcmG/thiol:disulfide interchange protein DsbE
MQVFLLAALLFFTAVMPAFADYPPVVTEKKLWSSKDFRGKQLPAILEKSKWINGSAPQTEGKVVLISFWATWCPKCMSELPELISLQKKFGKDLVVIGINEDDPKVAKSFVKESGIEFPVTNDRDGRIEHELGIVGIPHVLVVSADGIVRWQGYPMAEEDTLNEEKLAGIIQTSNADHAVATRAVPAKE